MPQRFLFLKCIKILSRRFQSLRQKKTILNISCVKLHLFYNCHFVLLKITTSDINRDKFQNENLDCLFNNFFFRSREDGHTILGNTANEI